MKKTIALLLAVLMLLGPLPMTVSATENEAPVSVVQEQTPSVSQEETEELLSPWRPVNLLVEQEPVEKSNSEFAYVVQGEGVYVTEAKVYPEEMTIPSEIDGLPVLGVTGFSYWDAQTKSLTIPDSVKIVTGEFYLPQLEKVSIGKGVAALEQSMFSQCERLNAITVAAENENFASVDGIVYNAAKDTVVVFPKAWGNTYNVPAGVKNVDILLDPYMEIVIVFPEESEYFATENGVVYNAEKTKIYYCEKDFEGKFVMPDSVTEIAPKAFFGCEKLTEVVISKNVTEISYGAFYGCKALKAASIPKSVKSIGVCAFATDIALEQVELPEGLEEIEFKAFYACTGLTSINLPETLTVIGGKAFSGNSKQTAALLTIPASVTEIDYEAFSGTGYTAIHLGEGTPYIGTGAFSQCVKLESLTVGNNFSYNNFGESAFANCTALKNVDLGNGLKSVAESMFRGCSALEKIVIPENINYISTNAFDGCEKLSCVEVKANLSSIGEGAFRGCAVNDFSFAEKAGVMELRRFAFSEITATSFVLPANVTTIGYGAFMDSKNLVSLDIPESVISMCGKTMNGTAWYENQDDGMVYLEHVLLQYKGKMSADAELTVKDGIRVIGDYSFENQRNLSSLTLSKDVQYFGEEVFAHAGVKNVYVDEENPYFSSQNGMLCNKEGTRIIFAPIDQVELVFAPWKTEYRVGEKLTLEDLMLKLTRRNGNVEYFYYNSYRYPNSLELAEEVDMSTAGVKTVKVNYAGHVVEYEINVIGNASFAGESSSSENEVSIVLSIDNDALIQFIEIKNLSFDEEKLELVSVEWLREDFNFKGFDLNAREGAASAESGDVNMKGPIAEFTFRVKEGVSEGTVVVSCDLLATKALKEGETESQQVHFNVAQGTVSVKPYTAGDLDGVEGVSSADAIYLLYHALFGSERYPVNQPVDYNGDGKTDSSDAIYLLYHALFGAERYPI